MKNFKTETQKHFNNTANHYDSSRDGRFTKPMYQPVLNELFKLPKGKLLDLGCGTGNILLHLKEKNFDLYGVDLSPEMIKEARKKLGREAVLQVADAEKLPYDESQFDIVLCNASFHHYPHPREVLSEMFRVMKHDAVLLIGEGYVIQPFRFLLNLSFRFSDSGDYHSYGQKELVKLLKENGFCTISIKKIGKCKRLYITRCVK